MNKVHSTRVNSARQAGSSSTQWASKWIPTNSRVNSRAHLRPVAQVALVHSLEAIRRPLYGMHNLEDRAGEQHAD